MTDGVMRVLTVAIGFGIIALIAISAQMYRGNEELQISVAVVVVGLLHLLWSIYSRWLEEGEHIRAVVVLDEDEPPFLIIVNGGKVPVSITHINRYSRFGYYAETSIDGKEFPIVLEPKGSMRVKFGDLLENTGPKWNWRRVELKTAMGKTVIARLTYSDPKVPNQRSDR